MNTIAKVKRWTIDHSDELIRSAAYVCVAALAYKAGEKYSMTCVSNGLALWDRKGLIKFFKKGEGGKLIEVGAEEFSNYVNAM